MEIERERGLTVESRAVRIEYRARGRQAYQGNLIDAPGDVDLRYQVSQSLVACEGHSSSSTRRREFERRRSRT
jgi:GTP-binding protein LepA